MILTNSTARRPQHQHQHPQQLQAQQQNGFGNTASTTSTANSSTIKPGSKKFLHPSNSKTFLARIWCVLVMIMITMGCSIVWMFQMAHSSSYFDIVGSYDDSRSDKPPQSALSAALQREQRRHEHYSIYHANYGPRKKLQLDNNNNHGADAMTTTTTTTDLSEKERHLTQKTNHKSENKVLGVGGGESGDSGGETSDAVKQPHKLTKKKVSKLQAAWNQEPPPLMTPEHQQRSLDDAASNDHKNAGQESSQASHHHHHHHHHQHDDPAPLVNSQINKNDKTVFTARHLPARQQQEILDEFSELQEKINREALEAFQNELSAVLDDPRRGGAGRMQTLEAENNNNNKPPPVDDENNDEHHDDEEEAIQKAARLAELRSIKATLALEASKLEHDHSNEHIIGSVHVSVKHIEANVDEGVRQAQERLRELYESAVIGLREAHVRHQLDPLFVTPINQDDTTPILISQIRRIPFEPQVPYLGVLVDAGRHYFPLSWLKHLVVYLYKLRFNMIHLRLTDDQTFNLQLESYPQLANPVRLPYNTDNKTYTPQEMRELVRFAKQYNISIVPEINVPGHAGGFAGIPDLVVMCASFICSRGYGLPLNVDHPELKTILKRILKEVISIFDNPPFLHLGGDEVNMADPCFYEVKKRPFNYSDFESDLKAILQELHYPLEKVIRWQRTGQSLELERAGIIEHFWEKLPGAHESSLALLPNGEQAPWFVSRGLYFDTNHDDDAMIVYTNTLRTMQLIGIPAPTAIIAGAFELGTDFWLQRNVATRLIAVALGASKTRRTNRTEVMHLFIETCRSLDIDEKWCNLQGNTATLDYSQDHLVTWKFWKAGLCERLTEEEMKISIKALAGTKRAAETVGYEVFWENFGETTIATREMMANPTYSSKNQKASGTHSIPVTGLIFDMVNSIRTPHSRIVEILEKVVAPLGFNLLQLRLVDEFGFGIKLESQDVLGYFANRHGNPDTREGVGRTLNIPAAQSYRELVTSAMENHGIQIIPELSISTDAGGWIHSGFAAACPRWLCDKGRGMITNISDPAFLPVLNSVLRELRGIFSTSPFLHLGHDNRESSSKGCLEEAGTLSRDPMTLFSEFEEKVVFLVEELGFSQDSIIRWNNLENKHYPDRTGHITHYQALPPGQLPKPNAEEKFFVTVDVMNGTPWTIYQDTRALVTLNPRGILGEIRDIGQQAWEKKNINLRLAAFSMGLQPLMTNENVSDEKEFRKKLLGMCESLKLDGCHNPDGSDVYISLEVEQLRYRDKMCSEFTYNFLGRIPRRESSKRL